MWLNNISVGFRALMAGAKIIIKYNVKGMRCDYREGPAGEWVPWLRGHCRKQDCSLMAIVALDTMHNNG